MWWFSLSNPYATPEEIIDRPILATVVPHSPNEARMQQLEPVFTSIESERRATCAMDSNTLSEYEM
jgi:hypothetical protein